MSGSEFVFDTNIFLYLQSGREDLAKVFNQSSVFVSVVTELELFSFKFMDEKAEIELNEALKSCFIVDLEKPIRQHTIQIRKAYGLKLPDAIIAATAIHLQLPLFTADKEFEKVKDLMLYLYKPE